MNSYEQLSVRVALLEKKMTDLSAEYEIHTTLVTYALQQITTLLEHQMSRVVALEGK